MVEWEGRPVNTGCMRDTSREGMHTMLISKKIRLEVSEEDAATLEFMQGKCRGRAL